MSRRDLRSRRGFRITANAAQLSIRDLRMRPLREVVEQRASKDESPLERAILKYVESIEDQS